MCNVNVGVNGTIEHGEHLAQGAFSAAHLQVKVKPTMAHGTPISILRLDRIDKRHAISIVLIHRKHAHNTLDLEIVASEGESAWATTRKFYCLSNPWLHSRFSPLTHKFPAVQESRLGQFKASDNTSTDDAWLQVLRASLLLDNPSTNTCSTSMPDLEGLEIVSQITKEGRLSLVVRQNLGKLTVSTTFPHCSLGICSSPLVLITLVSRGLMMISNVLVLLILSLPMVNASTCGQVVSVELCSMLMPDAQQKTRVTN